MQGDLILYIYFHYYLYQMEANMLFHNNFILEFKVLPMTFHHVYAYNKVPIKFQHLSLLFMFHPEIHKMTHHKNKCLTYTVRSFGSRVHNFINS
jgi:hypothetical protein